MSFFAPISYLDCIFLIASISPFQFTTERCQLLRCDGVEFINSFFSLRSFFHPFSYQLRSPFSSLFLIFIFVLLRPHANPLPLPSLPPLRFPPFSYREPKQQETIHTGKLLIYGMDPQATWNGTILSKSLQEMGP